MINTEQIVNKMINEKDKKDNLHLDMETFREIPGQRIIIRSHHSDNIWYYHTHGFYEINYVLKGSCINLVEEEPVLINEGSFILMNPGTFHITYCPAEDKVLNFLIDKDWFVDHFKNTAADNLPITKFIKNTDSENFYRYILSYSSDRETVALAEKIVKINNMDGKKKYLLLEAAMVEFLCSAMFENENIKLSDLKGENSDLGRKLINYLSDNYKDVTLEKIAEYAGYSKTHICRIFKDIVGKSFGEVLTNIRLERAKYSLINTDKTVKGISAETGYDSVEYFQRLFKRQTGVTPGEYRKKHS